MNAGRRKNLPHCTYIMYTSPIWFQVLLSSHKNAMIFRMSSVAPAPWRMRQTIVGGPSVTVLQVIVVVVVVEVEVRPKNASRAPLLAK